MTTQELDEVIELALIAMNEFMARPYVRDEDGQIRMAVSEEILSIDSERWSNAFQTISGHPPMKLMIERRLLKLRQEQIEKELNNGK